MAGRHLPDEVLAMVFDSLDLAKLVRCMSVCRGWMSSVLDHRMYWQNHVLDRTTLAHVNGFVQRLDRSCDRPVTIEISHLEPFPEMATTILPALLAHLHHTATLRLELHLDNSDGVFAVIRHHAPLLRQFTLSFTKGSTFLPVVPGDVFAGDAPLLTLCSLTHIVLPDPIPHALLNITTFEYCLRSSRCRLEQHRLAASFPQLSNLMLQGRFSWRSDTPGSLWPPRWCKLQCLSLSLNKQTLERAARSIGLSSMRSATTAWLPSDAMHWLIEDATGPLNLRIRDFPAFGPHFSLCFERRDTGQVRAFAVRELENFLAPEPSPRGLLGCPEVASRIKLLTFPAALWAPLAPHFPLLQALDELELVVYYNGDVAAAAAAPAVQFCSSIKLLALRSTAHWPCIPARDLAAFARTALAEAARPIPLALRNVLLEGDAAQLASMFAPITRAAFDAPVYVAWMNMLHVLADRRAAQISVPAVGLSEDSEQQAAH